MARINVTQNINLLVTGHGGVSTVALLRDRVNVIDNSLLGHPYLLAHIKEGSATLVPDLADPDEIARAAEEVARQARVKADAARALREGEQAKIDAALAVPPAAPAPQAQEIPAQPAAPVAETPPAPAPALQADPEPAPAAPPAPVPAAPAPQV